MESGQSVVSVFFLAKSVTYLGHRIDAEGQHPLSDKLEAVREAPVPHNVSELRSFLGLLNYYRTFLPNLATVLHPLNELLQTKRKWKWSSECNSAFQEAKKLLTTSHVLAHYDAKLPICLAADASAYGIGAVISHVMPNGEEKPVAIFDRKGHGPGSVKLGWGIRLHMEFGLKGFDTA